MKSGKVQGNAENITSQQTRDIQQRKVILVNILSVSQESLLLTTLILYTKEIFLECMIFIMVDTVLVISLTFISFCF